MTDIVERLRSRSARSQGGMDELDTEAADAIERLEHEVAQMTTARTVMEAEIERLRAEQANLRAALDHWFALVPQADRAQFPFTGQVP